MHITTLARILVASELADFWKIAAECWRPGSLAQKIRYERFCIAYLRGINAE